MDAYRFDAFDGAAGGDCQVVVARTVEPYAAAVGDVGFARDRGRSMCRGNDHHERFFVLERVRRAHPDADGQRILREPVVSA